MNTKRKSYAQGDVLLIPVDSIPSTATKPIARVEGNLVLAYGEVTNHCHRIAEPTTEGWIDTNDEVFIEVKNLIDEVRLQHGKMDGTRTPNDKPHDPITIPPGKYRVVPAQREFVSAKGVTRRSAD